MESAKDWLFQKLQGNLDELVKIYRQMLDLLRQEKEALIASDSEKIIAINFDKETLLTRLRSLDGLRLKYAGELSRELKLDSEHPRLLEIASHLDGEAGQRLRQMHATLELLLKRVTEHNKENAEYAASALSVLGGAVNEIKDNFAGKKTYQRKGSLERGPEKAGHIVSREA